MKIYGMKANHLTDPVGFSLSPLRLSYKVKGRGKRQSSARIRIYQDEKTVYDSGVRSDINSLCFVPDLSLAPRTRYEWDVQIENDSGETACSSRAFFETGKMDEPWQGQWIRTAEKVDNPRLFRRFSLSAPVKEARLYICGLGLYEVCINGEKAGDEYFSPFCNDYDHWLQYQTYDVTALLKEENDLSVALGDGWYKGRFGFQKQKEIYGDTLCLLCELHVTHTDGSETVIASDDSFQAQETCIRFSNIYDGEICDLTYASSRIYDTVPYPEMGFDRLTERLSLPVRVMHTLPVQQVIRTKKEEVILDFGQEITGFVTFRIHGEKGRTYHLKYSEILQDGCFYNRNLRTAKAEYTCISDGSDRWIRPLFTFYGFRYVLIEGFETVDPADFIACSLYSDMPQTGFVTTSHHKINRLAQNVLWSQRDNFLDVPTDCPQRDERMGWTGDAQVFCATACYQMDAAAFYTKYLHDMACEQRAREGGVPVIVPSFHLRGFPACAWADAAAIIPWTVYLFYGDSELLKKQYANMKMWAEWIYRIDEETGGKRLWQAGFHYADWLSLDALSQKSCRGGTDRDFIASCYYLYTVRLTAKAAGVLALRTDEARYRLLESEILAAIRREYFTADGRIAVDTQTACILSLFLGIPEEKHAACVRRTLDLKFDESEGELRTGFVGTSFLCRTLSQHGFSPLAYSLLLREDYPGWLYEVNMGATTVWERWNSVLPDGRISDTGMNSLNHYAYGAVMEWLYRDAAGLSPLESAPGFRKVRIFPHPDARLPEIDFGYESAVGFYRSAFRITGEKSMHWEVSVPFGGEAELILPMGRIAGNADFTEKDGRMTACVPAGEYSFECDFDRCPWEKPLMERPFAQLMQDDALWKQIREAAPDIETLFAFRDPNVFTFRHLRNDPHTTVHPVQLRRLEELLCRLSFGGKHD